MAENKRNSDDGNKGLDVRSFALTILVAVVIIFVGALIFIRTHQRTMAPTVNPKTTRAVSPQ